MMMMKRFSLLTAALVPIALGLASAPASARIVELGATATPLAKPACPPNTPPAKCFIVLARTTAVQSTSDGVVNPTTVRRAGWIIGFTVGLAQLSTNNKTEKSFLHQLDTAFGGTPQVAITVLKPGPKHKFTVVAETPLFHVLPYLGQLLQMPLSLPPAFTQFKPLVVKPGEVIGLTVPTWAPVLSYNLTPSKFVYRQSRTTNCKVGGAGATAQLTVGDNAHYLCSYAGTRVEFSATEITNQPYPKHFVH
jgi:hypothetical protein